MLTLIASSSSDIYTVIDVECQKLGNCAFRFEFHCHR